MDECYSKSLKLHWDCNDEVINYETYRNTCLDKKVAMMVTLKERWIEGGPGSTKADSVFENALNEPAVTEPTVNVEV